MKYKLIITFGLLVSQALPARAADINRRIIAELDPVAPGSAAYDEQNNGMATSKWGGNVDFNIAGVFSTGPELWTGNFVVKGPSQPEETYRREDFWPGERHKLDAVRLRWNFTAWQMPYSMRGWYMKAAYSYLRVNSRANRFTEEGGSGDAVPVVLPGSSADDETDLVTDIRHGVALGFGNRWLLSDQAFSVTLGTSVTGVFKRTVSIDSKDPMARLDYDAIIEDVPDARMTVRPSPEANLALGYAW